MLTRIRNRATDRLASLRSRIAPKRRVYKLLGRELPEGYGVAPYLRPSFDDWVFGRTAGRFTGFPDRWRTEPGVIIQDPPPVAVVVHVYYAELTAQIWHELATIPVPFDLVVTNSSGEDLVLDGLPDNARAVKVFDLENRGRDIWPLVAIVNAGVLDPYLLILKVHTKKSEWRAEHGDFEDGGSAWRDSFFSDLLSTRDNVQNILESFAADPSLGMVTASGSVLGPEFWGDNEHCVHELARRLQLTVDDQSLRFAAGSMYWCRGFVLQGLRALCLDEEDFEPEAGQNNATMAHGVERLLGLLCKESGLTIGERSALTADDAASGWKRYDGRELEPRFRAVPFYLPQFHLFEENNLWWGTGFTEWTNVASARAVYHGQYQPMVPTDVGFYDLRVEQTRFDQARLASFAGIEGFMYYYYWFAGRRLMSGPIKDMLASDLDFPFCIMWANENWTRRWDGANEHVLMAQNYEAVPAEAFIDDVSEFLLDDRYMTLDGRKILAVYRPAQIPNFKAVTDTWRATAHERGIGELCLLMVDVGSDFDGLEGNPGDHGLDGTLGFPPHNMTYAHIDRNPLGVDPRFRGNILGYRELVNDAIRDLRIDPASSHYPGAMVTFDNTARRQWEPDLWYGSNPYLFHRWLSEIAGSLVRRPAAERLVFLNAWNEWAEGAVLEPSSRHGRAYMLALRNVLFS